MFSNDSFFTLGIIERVGLFTLSLILATTTVLFLIKLCKNKILTIRIAIALVLFFFFTWLSPQIYYTYYLTIFDGLPVQVVIKKPPSFMNLINILFFRYEANLSAYSVGVLGWVLIYSAVRPFKKC